MLFRSRKTASVSHVPEDMEPVLLVSICTGETTAGFREKKTGKFTGICLIQSPADLQRFRNDYGITGEIPKIY